MTVPHYSGEIECIQIIEQLELGFNLGNALKYLWRAGHKNSRQDDLYKALDYIHRELFGVWYSERLIESDKSRPHTPTETT